jgi:hypothetical protein
MPGKATLGLGVESKCSHFEHDERPYMLGREGFLAD